MSKVTIDRELLITFLGPVWSEDWYPARKQLRAILAAPPQPEGDVPSILLPALRQYMHNDGSGLLAGYEYEITNQIVAELWEECEHLKDCQENAMLHVTGLVSERDTLRQQLAEARDEITQHSNDLALAYMKEVADMRQQRDRLAELLRMVRQDGWYHPLEDHEIAQIDTALAELK